LHPYWACWKASATTKTGDSSSITAKKMIPKAHFNTAHPAIDCHSKISRHIHQTLLTTNWPSEGVIKRLYLVLTDNNPAANPPDRCLQASMGFRALTIKLKAKSECMNLTCRLLRARIIKPDIPD